MSQQFLMTEYEVNEEIRQREEERLSQTVSASKPGKRSARKVLGFAHQMNAYFVRPK